MGGQWQFLGCWWQWPHRSGCGGEACSGDQEGKQEGGFALVQVSRLSIFSKVFFFFFFFLTYLLRIFAFPCVFIFYRKSFISHHLYIWLYIIHLCHTISLNIL